LTLNVATVSSLSNAIYRPCSIAALICVPLRHFRGARARALTSPCPARYSFTNQQWGATLKRSISYPVTTHTG
jgi:hypothetical protein